MTSLIKVIIAEDIEPIRKRYLKVLESHSNICVLADVSTGAEAYEQTKALSPHVVLMDIEMETRDAGIQATEKILSYDPDIKVIILTVYEESELIFSAFQLGACDYILKNAGDNEILKAVIDAYHNQSPIRPDIAGKVRDEFKRVKNHENELKFMLNVLATLTPSELETLYLLSSGHSRREVCKIRHVAMSTVKSHVHSILKKFNKPKVADVITTDAERELLGNLLKNYSKK